MESAYEELFAVNGWPTWNGEEDELRLWCCGSFLVVRPPLMAILGAGEKGHSLLLIV